MSRVLLIENDNLLAGNMAAYLKRDGHSVTWHKHPQAAIEAADTEHPQIVILDLVLGAHSGAEFLYEFRSYPEWQDVPVILHTGVSPEELASSQEALAHMDIAAYHYKPTTSLATLAKSVKRAAKPAKV